MLRPTYDECASSLELWQEYIDPMCTTSKEEFNAMSHADRVAQIIETFGPEPERAPTVEQVLADTAIGGGMHRWPVAGAVCHLTATLLRPCLEEAYDPTMPSWPSMVDLDELANA